MKKQFCSYEIALKLKELGFCEDCVAHYGTDKTLYIEESQADDGNVDSHYLKCLAPLWQQAIDWFREKYDIHIHINLHDLCDSKSWRFDIRHSDEYLYISTIGDYEYNEENRQKFFPIYIDTYHQAREKAVTKVIEFIQNEKTNRFNQET